VEHSDEQVNIFNIGSEDTIDATGIGEIVVDEMGLEDVGFTYTGGSRGWKGDVPRRMLSVDRIKAVGWSPDNSSRDSVRSTVRVLLK